MCAYVLSRARVRVRVRVHVRGGGMARSCYCGHNEASQQEYYKRTTKIIMDYFSIRLSACREPPSTSQLLPTSHSYRRHFRVGCAEHRQLRHAGHPNDMLPCLPPSPHGHTVRKIKILFYLVQLYTKYELLAGKRLIGHHVGATWAAGGYDGKIS